MTSIYYLAALGAAFCWASASKCSSQSSKVVDRGHLVIDFYNKTKQKETC